MSRTALLTACLMVLPALVDAQVDVGLDGGLTISGILGDAANVTAFSVPTGSVRLGFASETTTFEALASLTIARAAGTTASAISVMPGINFPIDEDGTYVRGEIGLLLTAGGGSSDIDFALGGAIGRKTAIEGGPFSYRLELGIDRWLGDLGFNQLRALVGLSATVG